GANSAKRSAHFKTRPRLVMLSACTHPPLRRFIPRSLYGAALVALASTLLGCSGDSTISSYVTDSALVVEPGEWDAECGADSDSGSGLHSSVPQLIRRGTDGKGLAVTSSPPTACNVPVRFVHEEVVDTDNDDSTDDEVVKTPQFGRDYVVDLFGYPYTGLVATEPGAPTVELDGEVVTPTWSGSCGRAVGAPEESDFAEDYFGPRRLVEGRAVVFRGCTLQPGAGQ